MTQLSARTDRDLTDDNVWIHHRRREIASRKVIIDRREQHTAEPNPGPASARRHRTPWVDQRPRTPESVLRKAEHQNCSRAN